MIKKSLPLLSLLIAPATLAVSLPGTGQPAVECHLDMELGELVCFDPTIPQGGSGSIAIRPSDAESDTEHPPAIFLTNELKTLDLFLLYKPLDDDTDIYLEVVVEVPENAPVTFDDVDGDGEEDLLIKDSEGGGWRVWYGPIAESRGYDDSDAFVE
jgi:hypothetical protein